MNAAWATWPCLGAVSALSACADWGGWVSLPPENAGFAADWSETDEPVARRRARLRLELGVAYFEQGRAPIALQEIKQAVAADPAYVPAHQWLGTVHWALNQPVQAEHSFQQAVRLAPQQGDAWHNLAWVQCQTGQPAQAQQGFERALRSPHYQQALKTRVAQASCHQQAGQTEAARQAWEKVLHLQAAHPEATLQWARLTWTLGDPSAAWERLQTLGKTDCSAACLWFGVKLARHLQHFEPAEAWSKALQQRYPTSLEAAADQRGAYDE